MNKSYGLYRNHRCCIGAMDALDIMCKTADVQLASWERKL